MADPETFTASHESEASTVDGFSSIARCFAADIDNETLVFRKFDQLGIQNLLYLQCEMMELEARLKDLDRDAAKDPSLLGLSRWWEALAQEAARGTICRPEAKQRIDLIHELRRVMKEYQEALVLQSQVASLRHPEKRVLDVCRYMILHHFSDGSVFSKIDGKAAGFLNDEKDLVALKPAAETDPLSRFLRQHWAQSKGAFQKEPEVVGRFKEHIIARVVNAITILVAAVFFISSMIGFYFVKNEVAKLVMIAVFTITFATSISLITTARRVEIFASTAAYAAVLVVFVSSDLAGSTSLACEPCPRSVGLVG